MRLAVILVVLVVAAEVMSRTVDWNDRSTCILWGDGAGAALLTFGHEGPEILSTHLHTDGSHGQDLLLPKARADWPSRSHLEWHNDEVFLG